MTSVDELKLYRIRPLGSDAVGNWVVEMSRIYLPDVWTLDSIHVTRSAALRRAGDLAEEDGR